MQKNLNMQLTALLCKKGCNCEYSSLFTSETISYKQIFIPYFPLPRRERIKLILSGTKGLS